MSLLITTSLIDSVNWAKSAPNTPTKDDPSVTWKEKAYLDLKNTLARIWTGGGPMIERGINFENTVYGILNKGTKDTVSCSPEFKKILDLCDGGVFQKKTKSFIQVDGDEYCLFGKMDVWFPDRIKDIKTTKEFKGRSKYLGTLQHKIYCYSERIKKFDYIIAEFYDEAGPRIKEVHVIPYETEDFDFVRDCIVQAIRQTMDFISMFDGEGDLQDLYLHKFNMYN